MYKNGRYNLYKTAYYLTAYCSDYFLNNKVLQDNKIKLNDQYVMTTLT